MFQKMHTTGRRYLIASFIVFAVFVADIIAARIQVLLGATLPIHMGATIQFLVLLLAVALFVMATLGEEAAESRQDPDR